MPQSQDDDHLEWTQHRAPCLLYHQLNNESKRLGASRIAHYLVNVYVLNILRRVDMTPAPLASPETDHPTETYVPLYDDNESSDDNRPPSIPELTGLDLHSVS